MEEKAKSREWQNLFSFNFWAWFLGHTTIQVLEDPTIIQKQ